VLSSTSARSKSSDVSGQSPHFRIAHPPPPGGIVTEFRSSPNAKRSKSGFAGSEVNIPLQWPSPSLPAEFTQRIPCDRASATTESGVPSTPVPSPALVPSHSTEWLTIWIPCSTAYFSASTSPTSEAMQIR
jgi:hypothetical protein